MKAYTDISQSKQLAEILPIESADMAWCNNSIRGVNYTDEYSANLYTIKEMQECFDESLNGWDKYWELIPCWSLAALLGVLPKSLIYTPNQALDGYCCKNIMYDLETYGDNPVDACYEMIIKLHEQELL